MSVVGSIGTGSGIDPATTAAQLAAAERATADARLARTETTIKAQVSAIGSLRSAMSNLQSALRALSGTGAAQARAVTLSNTTAFGATAATGAATGQYQVEVLSLAAAQKLASAGYAGGATSVVGTGTLTVNAGSHAFSVEIGPDANTLEGIRDAINAQAAGQGVQATIVNGDAGAQLVLTALDGGSAGSITVSAEGGDGGLAALTYGGGSGDGMTQLVAPADAQLKIDGILRTSSSNTVTDLLPGVTFTLKQADPGKPVQMTIASDTAAQLTAVKAFVTNYNAALYSIASTTNYNAGTKVAAALNGDAMVRGMSRQMRDMVGSDVVALEAMGITIGKDGTLTLSDSKFNAAAIADPAAVGKLFGSGSDSLGSRLNTQMTSLLASDGPLKSRDNNLTERTRQLAHQRELLDRRTAQIEARYKAQFIALDAMVTKLQSTSSFLSQQLTSSTSSQ